MQPVPAKVSRALSTTRMGIQKRNRELRDLIVLLLESRENVLGVVCHP
jgi:hypothetical protein